VQKLHRGYLCDSPCKLVEIAIIHGCVCALVSIMENEVRIVVKWSGKEYEICNLSESDSVGTLKNAIHKETGVRPERQKLLNLKFKGKLLY